MLAIVILLFFIIVRLTALVLTTWDATAIIALLVVLWVYATLVFHRND